MIWTAAVMSDDHLDPESLVGRMLNPAPEFTAEEVEMNAAPWSYLEPLPLWRAMEQAGMHEPGTPRDAIAAEIEALQAWLPDMPPPHLLQQWSGDAGWHGPAIAAYTMEWVRAQLTEQARIARGEP